MYTFPQVLEAKIQSKMSRSKKKIWKGSEDFDWCKQFGQPRLSDNTFFKKVYTYVQAILLMYWS